MADRLIQVFIDKLANRNEGSASTVNYYLKDFVEFCRAELKADPSEIIKRLKEGTATEDPKEEQPYKILSNYATWLKKNRYDTDQNKAHTIGLKISWARTLLDVNFIPISRTIFKQQVKAPKAEEPELSPISKKTVQQIIIASEDIRMQTYELWLASMGWRATESLTVQNQNFEGLNLKTLKFEDNPSFVNMSGRTAKTKKGKRRQLTAEMRSQIERYLTHKYRPRSINRFDRKTGKWNRMKVKPEAKPTDYLFLPYHATSKEISKKFARNTYRHVQDRFSQLMDRLGIAFEEDGKRHKVTLHTLRRFCYTACKRAVDESYAKYRIGRKIHEYDKNTDEQLAEDFAKVEPEITFLDTKAVEDKQKALQTQLDEIRIRQEQDSAALKAISNNLQSMPQGDMRHMIAEMMRVVQNLTPEKLKKFLAKEYSESWQVDHVWPKDEDTEAGKK